MIFKPELLEKVLAGAKTQTRRPAHYGEVAINPFGTPLMLIDEIDISKYFVIETVLNPNGNRRFKVNQSYAAQPGRGKPAQARIIVQKVRFEDVRNISQADAVAEGFRDRLEFWQTWCAFYCPRPMEYIMSGQHNAIEVHNVPRSVLEEYAGEYLFVCADNKFISWALDIALDR